MATTASGNYGHSEADLVFCRLYNVFSSSAKVLRQKSKERGGMYVLL